MNLGVYLLGSYVGILESYLCQFCMQRVCQGKQSSIVYSLFL
jgi:hypothetical protein